MPRNYRRELLSRGWDPEKWRQEREKRQLDDLHKAWQWANEGAKAQFLVEFGWQTPDPPTAGGQVDPQ
jgi:hypothetical protein